MLQSDFSFDSWPVKFAVLGILLFLRFGFFKWRPRRERWAAFALSGREFLNSAIVTLAVVFLALQPFIAQAYFIPTGSMENTLPPHDRILVSKWVYRVGDPKFRDVVVFEAPDAALLSSGSPRGTVFVKRCIGVPGDVVEIRNRALFRNGVKVAEPYTRWTDGNEARVGRFSYDLKIVGGAVYSRRYDGSGNPQEWTKNGIVVAQADQNRISSAPPAKVPAGMFLMLGDHRNASNDGHIWGFVPRQNVVGKAFSVFWPPRHWGVVDVKSRP